MKKEVESVDGLQLPSNLKIEIPLREEKPKIEFLKNNKVIFAPSHKNKFYFKTMNLRSVIVDVIHIKKSNILQFLQVNSLDTAYELYRVERGNFK